MKPRKYYRILYFDNKGGLQLFETNQFGDPNNWFDDEQEAEAFIQENFSDKNNSPDMVLVVVPIFTVGFR
jgi:hypothetical protein